MPKSDANALLDLYQDHASAWVKQRKRSQPPFEQPWLDRFLAMTPLGHRCILDLGCGSGQPIAEYLIASACHVTGVDGAPAMIKKASTNFPDQRWIVADMRNLPPMKDFHGVIAWHSFFHLTPQDQRSMFKTFARLCKHSAPLMFTSGTSFGETLGTLQGRPLYHSSLDKAEYRHLLQENGFQVVKHRQEDPSCGGATIWLAQKI